MYLNSFSLFLPSAVNEMDDMDSDEENDSDGQEIAIKEQPFEQVFTYKRMLVIEEKHQPEIVPVDIVLVCNSGYLIGLSVSVYDPCKVSNSGFLLILD